MKTKQIGLIALLAIITLALIACKEDEKTCDCNPKDHLGVGETCNCGASQPCGCTLKVYGKLGDVIPIYRKGNVTDEQMTAAVETIQAAGADALNNDFLVSEFQGIVNSIYVTSGVMVERDDKVVIIGCDATKSDIGGKILLIAIGVADAMPSKAKFKLAKGKKLNNATMSDTKNRQIRVFSPLFWQI